MKTNDLGEVTCDDVTLPGWALVIPWDPSLSGSGGVSQVVLNLADGLKTRGIYHPVVIVEEWRAVQPRIEKRDGIPYIFIRMRPSSDDSVGLLKRVLHVFLAWSEDRCFIRLVQAFNIRIVNFHYPSLAAERLVARPRVVSGRRIKVIFSLHGTDITRAGDQGVEHRTRYMGMLTRGDAVVAVSYNFADLVTTDLAPELVGKVYVIHNGVSAETIENYSPVDTPLPAHYILNVATFEEKKGQRYLLDAFARIASDYPDMYLVIAGRPAGEINALTQQVSLLNLQKRVLFLRDVPHGKIGELYASATIFCLSSLVEPFGIVVLEAGIFGLPVVASRIGGVPEILRDHEDGILVDRGDATQLAVAIRTLLDAPDRAAALGASLRHRVLTEFTWRRAVERYLTLAHSL